MIVKFTTIGTKPSIQGGSRIAGAGGSRTGASLSGLAVLLAEGYSLPYFVREVSNSQWSVPYLSLGFTDIDASTELTPVVQNYTGAGTLGGAGIDVAAAGTTRYYALGETDTSIATGEIDPLVTFEGRVMRNGWGSKLAVPISQNANLQQVQITVDAGLVNEQPGANAFILWAFLSDSDDAEAYYVATVEPGDIVIDDFAESELLARGPYSKTTFQNPLAARAVAAVGRSFVLAGNAATFSSTTTPVSLTVSTYLGNGAKVRLLNSTGSGTATDPITGGVFVWPEWVIGQTMSFAGQQQTAIIDHLEADPNGDLTIAVFENAFPIALSADQFYIRGQNFLQITHPDPRLADKCPAGLFINLGPYMDSPITAVMPDVDEGSCFVASQKNMVQIRNIPADLPATGVAGLDEATLPLVIPVPVEFGCAGPNAVTSGLSGVPMGFATGVGPWAWSGAAPQLLDPELRLKPFYDSLTESDTNQMCSAFSYNDRYGIFGFPNSDRVLCFDRENMGVGFWEVLGTRLTAACALEQYAGDGDATTTLGSVVNFGADTGDILDLTRNVYADFVWPDGTGQLAVTAVASNSVTVTGTVDLRVRDVDVVNVTAARYGSRRPVASVTGSTLNLTGSWSGSAPQVGDILVLCPINVMWEAGKFRDSSYNRVHEVSDLNLVGDPTLSWSMEYTALSSGQTSAATTETTTVASSAALYKGLGYPLKRSPGGRVVGFRLSWYNSPEEATQIDRVIPVLGTTRGQQPIDIEKFAFPVSEGDKAEVACNDDRNAKRLFEMNSIIPRPGSRVLTVLESSRPNYSATGDEDSVVLMEKVGSQQALITSSTASAVHILPLRSRGPVASPSPPLNPDPVFRGNIPLASPNVGP